MSTVGIVLLVLLFLLLCGLFGGPVRENYGFLPGGIVGVLLLVLVILLLTGRL